MHQWTSEDISPSLYLITNNPFIFAELFYIWCHDEGHIQKSTNYVLSYFKGKPDYFTHCFYVQIKSRRRDWVWRSDSNSNVTMLMLSKWNILHVDHLSLVC